MRPARCALAALLFALVAAEARAARGTSHGETSLMIDGKRQKVTLRDLGAMRGALVTYLAEHAPETRTARPANWRDRVPAPGDGVIDGDGIARLPPWLLEASLDAGAAVLTTRWMVPHGGGFVLYARLRRVAAGWTVDGVDWAVVRPPR
jgi:hypothetical protein